MPSPKLVPLVLPDAERASLEALSRKRTAAQALAERARVVLACAEKSGAPLTRVAERTGLSRESPAQNQAQRTCGSLLAALDVRPRVAMAILRHSRIALTMEVYTQVPDKTTRDALMRLSDLLGGPQDDAEATAETDDTGPATEDDADPPRTAAWGVKFGTWATGRFRWLGDSGSPRWQVSGGRLVPPQRRRYLRQHPDRQHDSVSLLETWPNNCPRLAGAHGTHGHPHLARGWCRRCSESRGSPPPSRQPRSAITSRA